MEKSIKKLICTSLCVVFAASAAGCTSDNNISIADTTAVQETSATYAPKTTMPISTDDSARKSSFNYVRIKEKSDDIMSDFNDYISYRKFKGVVYYKIGNDFEYISESGNAVVDEHKSNSLNTQFYIGSVTKQFTAAAIMKLVENKKLSVDDTLDKYFPDYDEGKNITIKNLLTMTSGIKSYMAEDGSIDSNVYKDSQLDYKISKENSVKENKKIIMDWILSQELIFEPDTQFRFSDSNYYLLGDIIEQVSGDSYEEYVQENLFKPAGMNASSFGKSDNLAEGYEGYNDNNWIYYNGVGYSSTGMISTVSDLLKWVYAIDEYEILSEESIKEMYTPYKERFAYGSFVNNKKSTITARSDKFSSVISYSADESEIYISLSNYKYSDSVSLFAMLKKSINPYRK